MPQLSNKQVCLVTLGLLGLSYFLNHFMRDDMYKAGCNFIYRRQLEATPFTIQLFNWVSFLVDPFLVTLLVIILFIAVDNKFRMFIMVEFFFLNLFVLGAAKLWYAESRPYWTSDEIKSLQWYCPTDYGNPSGHSWLASTFYYLLIVEYLGTGPYNIMLGIPFLMAVFVPLSRMYLGAHSYNQVLQGVVNSFAFLVLYRYALHDMIRDLINSFLNTTKRIKNFFGITIILNSLMFLLPIYIYGKGRMYELSEKQLHNLSTKCGISRQRTLKIDEHLLLTLAIVQMGFGLLYGINRVNPTFRFYFGLWRYTQGNLWVRRLQKFFLGDIVYLLPIVVAFLLGKIFTSSYAVYILQSAGFLCAGYLYSAKAAEWLVNFGIIKFVSQSSIK